MLFTKTVRGEKLLLKSPDACQANKPKAEKEHGEGLGDALINRYVYGSFVMVEMASITYPECILADERVERHIAQISNIIPIVEKFVVQNVEGQSESGSPLCDVIGSDAEVSSTSTTITMITVEV